MRRVRATVAVLTALVSLSALAPALIDAAAATPWAVVLVAGGSAQARADTAPAAPSGLTAACVGLLLNSQVTVSWNPVGHATSYSVYRATAGVGGPYTLAGTSSTTSWTSGAQTTGNYWYAVAAVAGTNWAGPMSAGVGPRTVTLQLLCT